MARWLGLNDLIAIQQLQTRGTQLDLERAVLWPHTPLQAALAAHWPFSTIGAETYVLYAPGWRGRALGFVQSRARRGRPEADISFLAPALDIGGRESSRGASVETLSNRHGRRLNLNAPGFPPRDDLKQQAVPLNHARDDLRGRKSSRGGNLKTTESDNARDDLRGDTVSTWYRLLAGCAQQIGERGGQRLFAQIANGNGIEEVFRQAGYSVYAREDVYRLDAWPSELKKANLLRHQRARDGWTLLRLYAQLTPRPVQIAEGMLSPEGQGGKMGDWWDQSRGAGYILEVEGELVGAVRVRRGSAAYWLRFWLHPQAQEYSETLLNGALALLWAAPHCPIYCSVRDYESGLRAPLEQANFQFLHTRSLLVKHTTVHAKETLIKLVPALEKRPEPAASVSHHSE